MELIKGEWRLGPQPFKTDVSGTVSLRGPRGEYELVVAGKKVAFTHDEGGRYDITAA